jgi:hypothetical protein
VLGVLMVLAIAFGVATLDAARLSGAVGPMSPSSTATTATTTTTLATTTTGCTVSVVAPTPVNRVVTTASPIVATGVVDDGTEYDVPVGTTFLVRLVPNGVTPPGCVGFPWGPSAWHPPEVSPTTTLQVTRTEFGGVVTATVVVVGPGQATISSDMDCVDTCSVPVHWSVSIHATPRTPDPTGPPPTPPRATLPHTT